MFACSLVRGVTVTPNDLLIREAQVAKVVPANACSRLVIIPKSHLVLGLTVHMITTPILLDLLGALGTQLCKLFHRLCALFLLQAQSISIQSIRMYHK